MTQLWFLRSNTREVSDSKLRRRASFPDKWNDLLARKLHLDMTDPQGTKETLRSVCPEWAVSSWHSIKTAYWTLRRRSKSSESVFSEIYAKRLWGDGESVSGVGSDLEQTAAVREALPKLLKKIGARTMVDAPCGDFHWMKETHIELERYIGLDIVPEIIARNRTHYANGVCEFRTHNITQGPTPTADVIFCRDCLVHLSNSDIAKAIRYFKESASTYLLTTTFTSLRKNRDIVTGEWRPLNLECAPWNFPKPLIVIDEECTLSYGRCRDKVLALWRLSDLPI